MTDTLLRSDDALLLSDAGQRHRSRRLPRLLRHGAPGRPVLPHLLRRHGDLPGVLLVGQGSGNRGAVKLLLAVRRAR